MTTERLESQLRNASRTIAALFFGVGTLTVLPAAATDPLTGRPAFALGDQQAERAAECSELRDMTAGLIEPDYRIDLAVRGKLAAVETDGALWYLIMCDAPDIQVMCITYQDNGMKPGDTVLFGGGYMRLNEDQIQLDPCLAGTPEAG